MSINTTTTTTNFDKDAIRAAAYDPAVGSGMGTIWMTGSSHGVLSTTVGGSGAGTQITSSSGSFHQVNVFAGQLYISSMTDDRVGSVGTGEPTTGGQTITDLTPNSNPYAFFFADLDGTVGAFGGVDTLYVADGTSGLTKYSFDGVNWSSNGSSDTTFDYFGITGSVSGGSVTLFATRDGSQLVTLTDSSGYNGTFVGAASLLASAGANTAFRGVAFAAIPEPAAVMFGALVSAVFGVTAALRKCRRTVDAS